MGGESRAKVPVDGGRRTGLCLVCLVCQTKERYPTVVPVHRKVWKTFFMACVYVVEQTLPAC